MNKIIFIILFFFNISSLFAKNFKHHSLGDWDIYIEKSIYDDKEFRPILLKQLGEQLERINNKVPSFALSFLKSIKIWISNETKYPFRQNESATFVYHVSEKWLKKNSLPIKLVKGIHLINPKRYILENRLFEIWPMITLHELSHAYHHQCLGFEHKVIKDRFFEVSKTNDYKKVKRRKSRGVQKSYALSDHHEFFAELSESYFGTNDFFPFNRTDLKAYDKKSFELIKFLWSIKKCFKG